MEDSPQDHGNAIGELGGAGDSPNRSYRLAVMVRKVRRANPDLGLSTNRVLEGWSQKACPRAPSDPPTW